MSLAVFLIIVMNMFAKLVSDQHTPFELVFWRGLFAMMVIVSIILWKRDISLFKTTRLRGQIIRGAGGSMGILLVFWAYSLMPMANVVAIMFTAGLMTTGLSALILREHVGPYRWSAVVFGLIGAYIAAAPEPGTAWNWYGTFVAFGAAFVGGALVSTMLRSLGKTEKALTTVFYTLLANLVITGPFVLYSNNIPDLDIFPILMACGLAGGISLIVKTQAFRFAEASLLSPVHYTAIVWASLLGWIAFDDIPSMNVFIGASLIIVANLVILWREHTKSGQTKTVVEPD